jgi:hypothetical protein
LLKLHTRMLPPTSANYHSLYFSAMYSLRLPIQNTTGLSVIFDHSFLVTFATCSLLVSLTRVYPLLSHLADIPRLLHARLT